MFKVRKLSEYMPGLSTPGPPKPQAAPCSVQVPVSAGPAPVEINLSASPPIPIQINPAPQPAPRPQSVPTVVSCVNLEEIEDEELDEEFDEEDDDDEIGVDDLSQMITDMAELGASLKSELLFLTAETTRIERQAEATIRDVRGFRSRIQHLLEQVANLNITLDECAFNFNRLF